MAFLPPVLSPAFIAIIIGCKIIAIGVATAALASRAADSLITTTMILDILCVLIIIASFVYKVINPRPGRNNMRTLVTFSLVWLLSLCGSSLLTASLGGLFDSNFTSQGGAEGYARAIASTSWLATISALFGALTSYFEQPAVPRSSFRLEPLSQRHPQSMPPAYTPSSPDHITAVEKRAGDSMWTEIALAV